MPVVQKEILAEGTYHTESPDGRVVPCVITRRDIKRFCRTGNEMIRSGLSVPVVLEHQDIQALTPQERAAQKLLSCVGWVQDYRIDKSGKLWGSLDIPDPKLVAKLPDTIRYVSPEIDPIFLDGNGRWWKDCVTHIALTLRPRISSQSIFGTTPDFGTDGASLSLDPATVRRWSLNVTRLRFAWIHAPSQRTRNRWVDTETKQVRYQESQPGSGRTAKLLETHKRAAGERDRYQALHDRVAEQTEKVRAAKAEALTGFVTHQEAAVKAKDDEDKAREAYKKTRPGSAERLTAKGRLDGAALKRKHVNENYARALKDVKAKSSVADKAIAALGKVKAELAKHGATVAKHEEAVKKAKEVQARPRPVAAAAPEAKPPYEGGAVEHGKVYNAPVGKLSVDPARFQYKLNTDSAHGVTDELKGVKTFNPDFAGVISVWQDPKDGRTWVVNGHHRYELAERLGHPDLAVRYVKANTAQEARAIGALINIAEGRGTAVDAAKFMRDMGVSADEMGKYGVSLKGKVASDAAAFVNLNDRLFNKVAEGGMNEGYALAMAKHLKDHDLQDKLSDILEEHEDKHLSNRAVEEMAKEMAETPKTTKNKETLFGDWMSEESLFVPRNELKAHVRSELSKQVNDFLAVANKRRAENIGRAGNVIDPEANKKIAEEANRVRNVYNTLVNRKGEISDAINVGAEDYSKAKTRKQRDEARKQTVEAVRKAVFREAGVGGEEAGAGGGAAANPVEPVATEAPAEEPGRGNPEQAGLTGEATAEPAAASQPSS